MSAVPRAFVDAEGQLIGIFFGNGPENGIEVPSVPDNGLMTWSFDRSVWYWSKEVGLAEARRRLNNEFTTAMQSLQLGWPIYEVLTWDKQATEASAWLAAPEGQKPATPFLTSLFEKCAALGAQDTLESLIDRVHANDIRYTNDVTAIMAVRHVAEDQIAASDDPMSVTWQFP